MGDGIRCMMMRGGTSKGAYFLAEDLPSDAEERDRLLLSIMGSPDPRQIDGIGGADPLTSKVAVVKRSDRPGIDVDYLFLQVFVDKSLVSSSQNCGNILAGVAGFAIERGLAAADDAEATVAIFLENTGQTAHATIPTPRGVPVYSGSETIDGVPNPAAPVLLSFVDAAGSTCGVLLPTGNDRDVVESAETTLIDNGMPVVVVRAADMGISGYETRQELEANAPLREKLERLRLAAGPLMSLGDVKEKSVPKMTMVAPPRHGGAIMTRTFIPHRCHASIGVFGALSVAAACLRPGSPAHGMAAIPEGPRKVMRIEHPTGHLDIVVRVGERGEIAEAAFVRTARKLFDGAVFPRY